MILLLLCIVANVVLALLFKLFPKYEVRNYPAIVVNYFTTVVVGSVVAGRFVIESDILSSRSIWYALAMSFLFIFGFNIMGRSFQIFGISFTTIIQKMSIILSAGFAILYYQDPFNVYKALGLAIAIVAIIMVNIEPKAQHAQAQKHKAILYLYPILTFLISAIIEILLLFVGVEGIVTNNIAFVSSCFMLAGIWGLAYILFKLRPIITAREVIAGVLLGIPNFFTIYLLTVLIEQGWDGSVLFPMNSIGILLLAAIMGYLFFKETFDVYKLIGVLAALASIYLISLGA